MFKKILALVLVVVLTATAAVGATVAYLTDRDSEANVFTVGDVSIKLNDEFEQGSALVPGEKINKDVTITNTGKNSAWVWASYAIPAALDGGEDASKNIVHVNYPGKNWLGYQNNQAYWDEGQTEATPENQCWDVDKYVAKDVEIEGIKYNIYTSLYNGPLAPNETTTVGMTQVYMDTHVDIDPDGNMHWVEAGVAKDLNWNVNQYGTPIIYVSAYAAQVEGFDTAAEAYEAYNAQWTTAEGVNNGLEFAKVTFASPEAGATRPAGYVPAVEGGVIDNLVVMDNSDENTNLRALYNGEGGKASYLKADLTINNSYLDGTYAMNLYAVEEETVNLTVNNTALMGWTSFTGFDSVAFNNCTFAENSEGTQNFFRAYDDCTLTNCELKGTALDTDGGSITLVNCTFNGELVDSLDDLIIEDGANVKIG